MTNCRCVLFWLPLALLVGCSEGVLSGDPVPLAHLKEVTGIFRVVGIDVKGGEKQPPDLEKARRCYFMVSKTACGMSDGLARICPLDERFRRAVPRHDYGANNWNIIRNYSWGESNNVGDREFLVTSYTDASAGGPSIKLQFIKMFSHLERMGYQEWTITLHKLSNTLEYYAGMESILGLLDQYESPTYRKPQLYTSNLWSADGAVNRKSVEVTRELLTRGERVELYRFGKGIDGFTVDLDRGACKDRDAYHIPGNFEGSIEDIPNCGPF